MKSAIGGEWKSGHRYMNGAYSRAVEEWTQIYEWCLQQGSGRVDTDIWMVLTAGQWKSGHRYMNGAYSRAVEEWTHI